MSFRQSIVPLLSMRKTPSFDAEVISQTILGEPLLIKKQSSDWTLIQTEDEYEGWVPSSKISTFPYTPDIETGSLFSHLYRSPRIEEGAIDTLPFRSRLQKVAQYNESWLEVMLPNSQLAYIQTGNLHPPKKLLKTSDLPLFSRQFLGLPYTWGGRSSFGYDCSGFVQMLYRQAGIFLPRDAKDQIRSPLLKPIGKEPLQKGDLIFFGKTESIIQHVACFLGKQAMIHATGRENRPWIRISQLTDPAWDQTQSPIYPFQIGYRPSPL